MLDAEKKSMKKGVDVSFTETELSDNRERLYVGDHN